MVVIQMRLRSSSNEELRAIGVASRICHRHHIRLVVSERSDELILELIAPNGLSTGTIS